MSLSGSPSTRQPICQRSYFSLKPLISSIPLFCFPDSPLAWRLLAVWPLLTRSFPSLVSLRRRRQLQNWIVSGSQAFRAPQPCASRRVRPDFLRVYLAIAFAHTTDPAVYKGDFMPIPPRFHQVRATEELRGVSKHVAYRFTTAVTLLAESLVRVVRVQPPIGLREIGRTLAAPPDVTSAALTAHFPHPA